MQPVARQRGSVQPVAACAVCSGIVHRWHSVATQDAWLQHGVLLMRHTCVAQRQMSRRAAGLAQRSAGDGFGCGADVGKGWTLSQCRGGQGIDSVQLQMWVEGGLGPVAEVGGYEPSPVVSDERSPRTQMRAYRGEPYQAALRCAYTPLQQMPLRATAGGAMRRAVHGCAAMQQVPLVRSGPLQGCSGALQQVARGCNRQCCDPTGRAALRWPLHAGVHVGAAAVASLEASHRRR